MDKYRINHLKELEAESIFVIREVASQFENPVMLFSGGKDSIVMFHLARKAFWPAKVPFPLMHIDTGHNFPEAIEYRDRVMEETGTKCIVALVQESINQGRVVEEKGVNASRNKLQTTTLLDSIESNKFDAAMGGGRRDEEKARAKERFFSHRDEFGQWDPKNNVQSYGIYLMDVKIWESTSVYFQSVIGQRWTYGSIFLWNKLICQAFILHINEKCLTVMEYG